MNVRSLLVLLILCMVSINTYCSKSSTGDDADRFVFPDSGVSFLEHVQPLFEVRCGLKSGCHSPSDQPTEYNRLTYHILMSRNLLIEFTLTRRPGEKLVDPVIHSNDPEIAPLYLMLTRGYPRELQDLMPPLTEPPLTDNQIQGIRQWIAEGCPE